MEVRFLPEAITADNTDWIYLQKTNGLPRKIKKSNLVFQREPETITSSIPPFNPQVGMVWNEINAENILVHKWNWFQGYWQSDNKVFTNSSSGLIANSIQGYFYLNPTYKYLINTINFAFSPNRNFTSSNNYELKIFQSSNVRRHEAELLQTIFNDCISNVIYSNVYAFNHLFSPYVPGEGNLIFNDGINSTQGFFWELIRNGASTTGLIYWLEINYTLVRR